MPPPLARIAAVAAGCFALSPAVAAAAGEPGAWSNPRTVARVNGFVVAPAIAGDGRAALALTDFGARGGRALLAQRSASGRWRAPRVLRSSRRELFDPAVAFSADGSAHVAWIRAIRLDQEQVLESRSVSPSGRAGELQRLSETGRRAIFPSVAGGPDGTALVSWLGDDYDLAAADLGGTTTELFDRRIFSSSVSFLPGGGAVALGHSFGAAGVRVRLRGTDGVWGEPIVLSGPRTAREPRVAVGADGTIAVAWAQHSEDRYRIQVAVRPPGGAFGPAVTVAPEAGEARGPAPAVLPDGRVVLAWAAKARRGAFLLRATEVHVAELGGTPQRVSAPDRKLTEPPQLVADADGDAMIAWTERGRRVASARRAADGTLSQPARLTHRQSFSVGLVGNARGDALLTWSQDDPRTTGALIQVAATAF